MASLLNKNFGGKEGKMDKANYTYSGHHSFEIAQSTSCNLVWLCSCGQENPFSICAVSPIIIELNAGEVIEFKCNKCGRSFLLKAEPLE